LRHFHLTRSATTVTLTSTSVTNGTKTAAASITVTSAIVVSVSPTTASVVTGGAIASFTATLQNDSQNKGVTWTLSGAWFSTRSRDQSDL
jgi:hypothetical protein